MAKTQKARTPKPVAVVVLGMHRSGTSALTRMLNVLGAELGNNLMPPAKGNNDLGFWEHQLVVDLNDKIFNIFGVSWDTTEALPEDWACDKALDPLRDEAVKIISGDFSGKTLWAVKDPRLCRLMPFWKPILDSFGCAVRYVLCLRDPAEVSHSLLRRDNIPLSAGYDLWLRHSFEMEQHTRGERRTFISYEQLLTDWRQVAARIGEDLEIPEFLSPSQSQIDEVNSFIRPDLRHHTIRQEDTLSNESISRLVRESYAVFADYLTDAGHDVDLEISSLSTIYTKSYAHFHYLRDGLSNRIETLKRDVHNANLQILERDRAIIERDASVAERDDRIRERDARIQDRDVQIQERDVRLQERDAQIGEMKYEIEQLCQTLDSNQAANASLVLQIRELSSARDQLEGEIQAVRNSTSWKITAPLRSLRNSLAPFRGRRGGEIEIELGASIAPDPAGYRALNDDPHLFISRNDKAAYTVGSYLLSCDLYVIDRASAPKLYIDTGNGFEEASAQVLPFHRSGRIVYPFTVTASAARFRFDPIDSPGVFRLENLTVTRISKISVLAEMSRAALRAVLRGGLSPRLFFTKAWRVLFVEGIDGYIRRQSARTSHIDDYQVWIDRFDAITDLDVAAMRRRLEAFPLKPLISVIIPTYNSEPELLRRAIESVRAQIYDNWELCIADDASSNEVARDVLREYEQVDHRIQVTRREENGHISEASNSALACASGEFVALLDHDDELSNHALFFVVDAINRYPDANIFYSDEDKLDLDGTRVEPYFKPDWNPELFLSQNYVSHLGVYRTQTVQALGGFRKGLEGSQDYDLALRVTEISTASQIVHIPHILYHWRKTKGSTAIASSEKSYAVEAAFRAVREHLDRKGEVAEVVSAGVGDYWRVRYQRTSEPSVSIIIPTRDRIDLLRMCLDSVRGKSSYSNYEIVVVDNNSCLPESLAYLEEQRHVKRTQVLIDRGVFNFSRINNFAATKADGDYLLFVNNDIEIITADWIEEMLSFAMRPDTGAVGVKLLYPNETVQHGGIILGIGGVASHAHLGLHRNDWGYFGRAGIVQNFSAVTGACMMIKASRFLDVGGFDEVNLPVAFNDVDLCLRLLKAGYRNIWTPFAQAYHYESASRGRDREGPEHERFQGEIAYMKRIYGAFLNSDPAYNPNLTLNAEDFGLANPPRKPALT